MIPAKPEGIVLTSSTGEEVPVKCKYMGTDDATHQWQIVVPKEHEHTTWIRFACATLPGKTSLIMPFVSAK